MTSRSPSRTSSAARDAHTSALNATRVDPAPASPSRLDSITALRFFAALIVVLSHTTRDLAPVPGLSEFAVNGTVGVGFFFALSGFVLTWSHRAGDRAGRFYRRRFARVYPLHFITYLLSYPTLLLAGANMGSSSVNPTAAVASPLLIQAWFPQLNVQYGMNGPSWSLSNEAFFYLLFPFVIPLLQRLSERQTRLALVLVVAIVIAGALAFYETVGSPADDGLYVNPAWRILGFLAGALLARSLKLGWRVPLPLPWAVALAVAAYSALPALLSFSDRSGISAIRSLGFLDAMMLPVFLVLIGAAAGADLDRRSGFLRHALLVKLGEWSFALYLTHWLLIDLIIGLWPQVRTLPAAGALTANAVVVVIAVCISAASYHGVEQPLERRLRGRSPRRGVTESA